VSLVGARVCPLPSNPPSLPLPEMHFEYISSSVVSEVMSLQMSHRVPVINCILNVLDVDQMVARFHGRTDMHVSIAATIHHTLEFISKRK
jgi:6,7-dimethyl-8-ribityllumazine synthase